MRPQIIAFDIGGVLADIDKSLIKNFLQDTDKIAIFYNNYNYLEMGLVDPYYFLLQKSLLLSCCPNRLLFVFTQMIKISSCSKYLRYLKIPYLFISNINKIHYRYFLTQLKPSSFAIRQAILSYQLGLLKPNPEFFRYLCVKTGIKNAQITLIDDKEANIEVAKQLGFNALLCNKDNTVPNLLQSLGLL